MKKLTKQIAAGIFLNIWKLTGYRLRKISHFSADDSLKTIVIFSTSALGDFLVNTPAIRAIKQRWPASRIILVIHSRNRLLAEGSPLFEQILYWNGRAEGVIRLAKKLRAQRPDAAFILHSRPPYDIITTSLARIPIILKDVYYGDYLGRDSFYLAPFLSAHYDNRLNGNIHLIRQKTQLLQSVGIDIPSLNMFIPAPFTAEKSSRRIVGIHAGASSPERCWPAEKFSQLILRLTEQHPEIDIALIGGPGEKALNQKIIDGLPGKPPRLKNFAGTTDLKQLVEKIASFTCLVVGDTGPLHIAIAVKTPVVGLWGCQMSIDGAGPLQDEQQHHIIMAEDESQGVPAIGVADVLHAVEQCIMATPSPAT